MGNIIYIILCGYMNLLPSEFDVKPISAEHDNGDLIKKKKYLLT